MKSKIFGALFVFIGLLLLGASLWLSLENIQEEQLAGEAGAEIVEDIRLEIQQGIQQAKPTQPPEPSTPDGEFPVPTEPEIQIPDYLRDPNMEMPTVEVDGKKYIGIVEIPRINMSLPVASEWTYPQLKQTPCRYQGTAYLDNFILMAHNYTTHFGPIHSLRIGDEIYFTDTVGNVFIYAVVELETLPGHAVEEMKAGQWDLTLFTCTLGGQNRITVRCERIGSQ